jgi:hypothetical protein
VAKVLKLVVAATGLSELAKTQHIEFSVGMDGTRLYPGATLCVGGIKIILLMDILQFQKSQT